MAREDGRLDNELRKIVIKPNYIQNSSGSVLISFDKTIVLCTANLQENKVPPHLKGLGTGWVTAEYSLLPGSTLIRKERERIKISGRTLEIQRLIGRSLRSVVDLSALHENTIIVDCDVLQADGGTRTVSVTGGYIALVLALRRLKKLGKIDSMPVKDYLSAISVGIVGDKILLDLTYDEDSKAKVDMNVVMNGKEEFVEIQATGEEFAFSKDVFDKMLSVAKKAIIQIIEEEKKVLGRLFKE